MERSRCFPTGAKIGRKRHEPDYDADEEDNAVRLRKRNCRPPLIQFHTHRSGSSSSVKSVPCPLAALTGDHDVNSSTKSSRLSYTAPLLPAFPQIPASPAATITKLTFKETASPGLPLPLELGEFLPFKVDVPPFDDGMLPLWFEDSDPMFLDVWPLSPLAKFTVEPACKYMTSN